jgi:hypothetical protein
VKGFKVEVKEKEGDSTRRVTFSVPSNLVARVAKFSPIRSFGGDIHTDWDGDVTPRDILDAAAESAPGKPGVIKKGNDTIEVMAEGTALEITIRDDRRELLGRPADQPEGDPRAHRRARAGRRGGRQGRGQGSHDHGRAEIGLVIPSGAGSDRAAVILRNPPFAMSS